MNSIKKFLRRAWRVGVLNMLLVLVAGFIYAQPKLPVVRASKPEVDIRNGNLFRKAHWTAVASVEPDIYYARRSKYGKSVTFYTDLDSIKFDVTPGHHYDFIVLKGRDSCYTRISTEKLTYGKLDSSGIITTDTIPFTIGTKV